MVVCHVCTSLRGMYIQAKGEKAFVHCKAGHGRSAAVALCWLMTQNPGKTVAKSESHPLTAFPLIISLFLTYHRDAYPCLESEIRRKKES